jgi:hypothetical protein
MNTIEQRVFLARFYRLTGLFNVRRLSELFRIAAPSNGVIQKTTED